jgi:hypothetical protein
MSLEDERIERCMAADSPSVAFFLDAVGDLAWEKAPPLNDLQAMKVTDPDDPLLVIAATLLWRWEHDKGKGKRTKMRLSPRNRQRWYAVKDLVEESWTVESTTEVTQIARRILDILELPEDVEIPDWLEELLEVQVVPHEYRGRYSYRQEQRTPDTPNLACIQVGYRVPSSAWGIVVDRSGSISTMLEPLQQGLDISRTYVLLTAATLKKRVLAYLSATPTPSPGTRRSPDQSRR